MMPTVLMAKPYIIHILQPYALNKNALLLISIFFTLTVLTFVKKTVIFWNRETKAATGYHKINIDLKKTKKR